jgi:hypothetical protein
VGPVIRPTAIAVEKEKRRGAGHDQDRTLFGTGERNRYGFEWKFNSHEASGVSWIYTNGRPSAASSRPTKAVGTLSKNRRKLLQVSYLQI